MVSVPSPGSARPDPAEHAPYYARYIAEVPDGDVLRTLETQGDATTRLLRGVAEDRGGHRYAPGKWSLKEVVGHVNDVERVFALRALAFARGERAPLFGMEQDEWVAAARFDRRTLRSLAEEFAAIRQATLRLLEGLAPEDWPRRGTASGVEFTVRAIPWILAGHERHHLAVVRERYLGVSP